LIDGGQEREMKTLGFTTRQIHADGHQKPEQAHVMPIVQTAAFYFNTPEEGKRLFTGEAAGNIYTRVGNPTVMRLEKTIASLEEGKHALAFSSGMAAINSMLLALFQKGDHIVSDPTLYGTTIPLLNEELHRHGIETSFVDMSNPEAVTAAIRPETIALYFETPANPTLKIIDIRAMVELGAQYDVLTILDNTFATPYFQRPLSLGVDLVVHSATKFLNGHGDVVAGAVVTNSDQLSQRICDYRTRTGAILGPMDAFLVSRGLKTLSLRMDRHQQNAMLIADFLDKHQKVVNVYYPGLPASQGHNIALNQMSGFSSLISFEVAGGLEAGKRLMKSVELFTLAVSLGSIDSLIQHPASMTHACMSPVERQKGATMIHRDQLIAFPMG